MKLFQKHKVQQNQHIQTYKSKQTKSNTIKYGPWFNHNCMLGYKFYSFGENFLLQYVVIAAAMYQRVEYPC